MSLHTIFKNRYLILALSAFIIVSTHLYDLKKQILSANQENTMLSQNLSLVFNNAIDRSLRSFSYIGHSISTHLTADQHSIDSIQDTNAPIIVAISPPAYIGKDISSTQIKQLYGLSNQEASLQMMLDENNEIWRIEQNIGSGNLDLIMGKRVTNLANKPFVEITFKVDDQSPIIPSQLNSKILFVNSDNSTSLRNGDNFTPVKLSEKTNGQVADLQIQSEFIIQKKTFLGYEFYQINNDTNQQYQMINIFVSKLHGTIKVLTPSTDQLNNIHNDFNEILISLLGLMVTWLFTHYSSRYIKHTQKVMNLDALTGLNNRYFLNNSQIEMQKKINEGSVTSYGVLALDIDYFKKVNDTYGHDIGDQVLIRFGQVLSHNTRKEDGCYRIGGEEFIIFTPCHSNEQAIKLAERLRQAVESDSELQQLVDGGITTSLGISWVNQQQSVKQSMKVADEQLYIAKNSGRNVIKYA